MTAAETTQLVVSVSTLITTLSAFTVSLLNRKKLTTMDINLDGRLTELLRTSGAEQKAIGGQEERDRTS
jgi:hypothetical protein